MHPYFRQNWNYRLFSLEYRAEEHTDLGRPLAKQDGQTWKVNAQYVAGMTFVTENGYTLLTVCRKRNAVNHFRLTLTTVHKDIFFLQRHIMYADLNRFLQKKV